MSSKDKISLVVPVYNVAEYLHRCINSLIRQTYPNLEIILVDDGSTDSSGSICDYYAAQNNNIKVIHQNNSGVSAARNRGLGQATGDYIGFVDPDDFVELDMYQCLYDNIVSSRADIIVCYWVNHFGNKVSPYSRKMFSDILSKEDAVYRDISTGMNTIWNKMFSKTVINNVCFNEHYINGEDRLFFVQAYMNANKIKYINQALYHYCHRDNSAGTKKFTRGDFLLLEVCEKIKEICKGVSHKSICAADIQIDNSCVSIVKKMNYKINDYPPYGKLVLGVIRKRWRSVMLNEEASLIHKIKMTAIGINPYIYKFGINVRALLMNRLKGHILL